MPRTLRLTIPGIPHHVTQKGNNRRDIFIDDNDRSTYIAILKERAVLYNLQILGYCLMTNHIHLVAIPLNEKSLSICIGNSHRQYTQYFNKKYGENGHLWHSRFYSCPLDDSHFIHALVYVDRNPVRAGLVELPWDYQWSSAQAHRGYADSGMLPDKTVWDELAVRIDWQTVIKQAVDREIVENIRRHTESGYPLGSEDFLKGLVDKYGISVRRRPRGRPGNR